MSQQETYILLKDGNQDGISVLYNRYGKKLYGYAVRNWKLNEDEAWDIVYKTIYQIVSSIGKYEFEDEKKFSSFVFKIFINYLRNHYRDEKRRKETLSFTPLHEVHLNGKGKVAEANEEQPRESVSLALLKEELDKLEDWERILLLLRSQELSYEEIAKHVDKPANQLKVYYQRLKNKIEERLSGKINVTT